MAEFNLPEFSINSASTSDDILRLMKIIKPLWKESDVEIKSMSGGYSCSMYKVSPKSDPKDAVTLRTRSVFSDFDVPGVDHEFENKIIQVVANLGIFPPVYAIFKNGYCYQYIEGKPIFDVTSEVSDLKQTFDLENFPLKLIAIKMAEVHCTNLENEDFSKTKFLSNILDVIDNHYPTFSHPSIADKDDLRREFNKLLTHAKKFDFKYVLCHGDAHPGNIVWNEKLNQITFVDWEYTCIGLQAYDLAFLLVAVTDKLFLNLAGFSSTSEDLAEEIKKKFVRYYLEEYSKLSKFDLTDDYVTEFERQVKFCILLWYVTMAANMGPVMKLSDKCPDWDKISTFGSDVFQRYLSIKDRVFTELNLI